MPIFAASCIFSSCHAGGSKKAGLVLGDPSSFGAGRSTCADDRAKWGCSVPKPLDPNLLTSVYDSLLAPSTTVQAPSVPRVTPFDPTKSFLVDKVTDNENGRGYACQNQDPSTGPEPCGGQMPLGGSSLEAAVCASKPGRNFRRVRLASNHPDKREQEDERVEGNTARNEFPARCEITDKVVSSRE